MRASPPSSWRWKDDPNAPMLRSASFSSFPRFRGWNPRVRAEAATETEFCPKQETVKAYEESRQVDLAVLYTS